MDRIQQIIEDESSIAMRYQIATGVSFPPILPFQTIVQVPDVDADGKDVDLSQQSAVSKGLQSLGSALFQCPVKFRLSTENEDGGFVLPVDPVMSINQRNIIVRRNVAKSAMRGTIKERWSQDDYEINIAGVLMDDDNYMVEDYMAELRRYIEAKESIIITSNLLNNVFDITRICIESCNFPFTAGVENQAFSIKAYSDDIYTLLEEIDNV